MIDPSNDPALKNLEDRVKKERQEILDKEKDLGAMEQMHYQDLETTRKYHDAERQKKNKTYQDLIARHEREVEAMDARHTQEIERAEREFNSDKTRAKREIENLKNRLRVDERQVTMQRENLERKRQQEIIEEQKRKLANDNQSGSGRLAA